MKRQRRYPTAVDPEKVGKYPARTKAGGGYVWDELLEYRVWCHPERGAPDLHDGDDYYLAFATYPKALAFSKRTRGAERPLALVRQRQYIDEPEDGQYVHVKKVRITEWLVEWLQRPRRTRDTIPNFLAKDAPANRLDILRGLAKPPRAATKRATKRRYVTN
jgi:putative acetyltransferase